MKFTPILLACALIFVGCASNNVAGTSTDQNISSESENDIETQAPKENETEKGKAPSEKADTKTETTNPSDVNPSEVKPTESEEKKTDSEKDKNQQTAKPEDEGKVDSDEGGKETPQLNYEKKSSLKAACDEAKFSMAAPEEIGEYKISEYRANEGHSVEIVYENSKQTISIKKSLGNLETSISESEYEINRFVNDGGNRFFLRGDSLSRIYICTWSSGDYSFSIESSAGMPRDSFLTLAREIN